MEINNGADRHNSIVEVRDHSNQECTSRPVNNFSPSSYFLEPKRDFFGENGPRFGGDYIGKMNGKGR